ncbi:hypothetical protein ANN_11216 [Periplaneta americana]|uniref:HAT C-terminal dimerisation domain-containing protein n=1 Tax=Periplaneta americana TaxID=6978 RepID=A0ABQ8T5U1_PERAM|nr:hypothetical protein ANN_11216 [Periplaneta americana]
MDEEVEIPVNSIKFELEACNDHLAPPPDPKSVDMRSEVNAVATASYLVKDEVEEENMVKEEMEDVTLEKNDVMPERLNSVQRLLRTPFSRLTREEKLLVKTAGPHQPDLAIVSIVTTSKRVFRRSFKRDWYEKYKWLCGCDVVNALFCFPCLLFGGDTSWTKRGVKDLVHLSCYVKRHEYSLKHVDNQVNLAMLGRDSIATQLNQRHRSEIKRRNEIVEKNRYILSRLIDCIKFCGAFELAMALQDESQGLDSPRVSRGLVNFVECLDSNMKVQLETATAFKGMCGNIQNELLQCMLDVCRDQITEEIKKADFLAVQIDETTDVSTRCHMVIVYRYVLNGEPVERFWGFLSPLYNDAETLASELITELNVHLKGTPDKLIAQSYDGGSVTNKNIKIVQAIVRHCFPRAHYIHCYAHHLNLVMEHAASEIDQARLFFANLSSIPPFFSRSCESTQALDQEIKRRLPKGVSPRWNYDSKTVTVISQNRKYLIQSFQEIKQIKPIDSITLRECDSHIRTLEDPTFIYWLSFFSKIMPKVEALFDRIQQRNIDAEQIHNALSAFECSIKKVRDSINEIPPPCSDPPPSKRGREQNKSEAAKEVCDVIVAKAKAHFTYIYYLTVAKLLSVQQFSYFQNNFPIEEFREALTTYPQLFDEKRLHTELEVLYSRQEFRQAYGVVPILKLFVNSNLEDIFPEVIKLLKILITIPMITSEAERCFPTVKRIKTFLRNSIEQDSICALAMLAIEKPLVHEMKDFNFRVIEKFASQKHRTMDFLYK